MLGSWGDVEGLAGQHTNVSAEAQDQESILVETLPADFEAQGVHAESSIGANLSGPDRGDDGSERHFHSGALHGCTSYSAGAASSICRDRDCNPFGALRTPPAYHAYPGAGRFGFEADRRTREWSQLPPLPPSLASFLSHCRKEGQHDYLSTAVDTRSKISYRVAAESPYLCSFPRFSVGPIRARSAAIFRS
jgi:hypothetical protein